MRVDEFALARGATEPVTAKQTAEKVWEPRFLAAIMAGRDPSVPPSMPKAAVGLTIADFLDLYYTNYVEAEGLRDPVTIKGHLKALKAVLGNLPVSALEKPGDIFRFKAAYRKGRELATVNRALSTLRAAINWGRFQDPPYLMTTPFHLSSGRNAAHSESARGLGTASDRDSWPPREGCRESPHSVRFRRSPRADSQTACGTRPKRVREQLQDGLDSFRWHGRGLAWLLGHARTPLAKPPALVGEKLFSFLYVYRGIGGGTSLLGFPQEMWCARQVSNLRPPV